MNLKTGKGYRAERRKKCLDYLRKGGSLPRARKLAKLDHWGAPTSAWIGALGELLKKRWQGKV